MAEHLLVKVKSGGNSNSWVINETFSEASKSKDVQISFTSNGTSFSQFSFGGSSSKYYGLIYYELDSAGIYQPTFPLNSNWTVEGYRTVTFNEPITDDLLLTWLQENAIAVGNVSNYLQVKTATSSTNSRLYTKIKSNKPQKSIIGKTWVANKTINLPQTTKTYNLDFYYYGVDAKTKRTSPSLTITATGITYGASTDYATYSAYNTAWTDTFCDVISITGGVDTTNDELITFLEANGKIVDTINDLQNTTWTFLPSTEIQPFSNDETALYGIKSITTTDKFQTSGDYILYYSKSMYLPVTYKDGSVDLANGTNIWSDNANTSSWWYHRSDMTAQQYKNLNMQPIVQINGGNSVAVLRVINYFQKNATLFDGEFIDAGTYKWVDAPDIKSIYKTDDTIYVLNFRCDWDDVSNNKTYTNKEFTGINIKLVNGIYWLYFVDPDNTYCYAGYISTNPSMDGRVSNPVIALKSPVDVNFKTWFLSNTTKI